MANTLRFKRGLVSTIPTAALGEPLFTTDTFDLYIGNGTTNTRFQKYIASGTTSQLLRGDGSLLTMPIVLTSPSSGQVLKYNGTSWVNDSDAGITGSGTTNYLPKFTGASTLGNSLVFDNGTNVGIGTASPSAKLDVLGAIISTGTYQARMIGAAGGAYFGSMSAVPVFFQVNQNEVGRFTAGGNFIINNASVDNGLRFQVTGDGYFSGSVGVGASAPFARIDGANAVNAIEVAASGRAGIRFNDTSATNRFFDIGVNNNKAFIGAIYSTTPTIEYNAFSTHSFVTNSTTRMTLDASGNLGLGVVPSAWGSAYYKALELTGGALTSYQTASVELFFNSFDDASSSFKYKNTGFASRYVQVAGEHRWFTAPSGTAGAAITYTRPMTLDASGRLGIGTTTPIYRLDVFGDARFGDGNNFNPLIQFAGSGRAAGSPGYSFVGDLDTGMYNPNLGNTIAFSTAGVERMRLDASGNLGLGVVPSAWYTPSKVIQVFNGALEGRSNLMQLWSNGYVDAAGNGNYYISNGYSTKYTQFNGEHQFYTAPSGTAGNAVSFTQAMTLTSGGLLQVGTTTGAERLNVNGSIGLQSSGTQTWHINPNASSGLEFVRSGIAERMVITSGGNVLIGTTTDAGFKLDVNGTMRVSGFLTGNNNAAFGQAVESTVRLVTASSDNTNATISLAARNLAGTLGFAVYGNLTSYFGGSATVTGNLTVNGVYVVPSTSYFLGNVTNGYRFNNSANTVNLLVIADSGAATFSSSVTAGGILTVNSRAIINGGTTSEYALNVNSNSSFAFGSTNGRRVAYFAYNTGDAPGIQLGYDATDNTGIIAGSTSALGAGIDFYTYNGSTWGSRLRIASTGAATFSSSVQAAGYNSSGGAGYSVINSLSNTVTALRPTGGGASIMSTNSNGLHIAVGTQAAGDLILASNNTERIRLSSNGFFSQLNATNPSASITDSYIQYSADVVAGNAAPHFRTENGAVIKLYQETTAVGNSTISVGGGNAVLDDTEFGGYTLRQVVQALKNQGILA